MIIPGMRKDMIIAKEGLIFILPAFLLAVLMGVIGWRIPAVIFLLLALAFLFFFRDPIRISPPGDHLIVAPADGKVVKIEDEVSPGDGRPPVKRISIFLSLLDVHVTRSPVAGRVEHVDYHPGKFLPAYRDEAAVSNESNTIVLKGPAGDLLIRQIVGVAARRIKCFVRAGDTVAKGRRIGLMYFGSRVELHLPPEADIRVVEGQKVKAGISVIAEIPQ
jgi:phosphatidylserine decarboxylase